MTRLFGILGKIILVPNKGTRILGHKTKVWCENSCGLQITVLNNSNQDTDAMCKLELKDLLEDKV